MNSILQVAALLATVFVELHGPTGQLVEVNPNEVSSLRTPLSLSTTHRHWAAGTNCVVVMTNGTFLAVSEDCAAVLQKMR